MECTIRQYKEDDLKEVMASWENANELAHPFLTKEFVDKAQELHGDLEVEVFEANAIGQRFYSNYGFKSLSEKIHEDTGSKMLRLKFTANK